MSPLTLVDHDLLDGHAADVAPRLLGLLLATTVGKGTTVARITEVEAYEEDDPASHTFSGRTPRNEAMFHSAGHLYVYLSYGIHRCANVVVGPADRGAAVLIRAVDVATGIDLARERRGGRDDLELSDGPGKVCQALGIHLHHGGLDLLAPSSPVRLLDDGTPPPSDPIVGPRVGISKAVDLPWRFRTPSA